MNGYRVDSKLFGNRPRFVSHIEGCRFKRKTEDDIRPKRVLRRTTAQTMNQILQEVVERGTGRRAALPNRPVAGKTGTTENYGDAWFVGYTPQLVAAVWVGYPNVLRPMETEFQGEPVAGGTFPALIWRSFMHAALRERNDAPMPFEAPPFLSGTSKRVVWRDGRLLLDNGLCRGARSVVYFTGRGPTRTARCKPNEVEVPNVVGRTLAGALERLAAQPLTAVIAKQPAKPLQPVGRVVAQSPKRGRLSSHDSVTLVVSKPLHGVVPNLIGLTLRQARVKLRKVGLTLDIAGFTDGESGIIVAQSPRANVAARKDLDVSVVVGRG
jgi:membrane peptidoglycan carboxypeptidase